MLIKFLKKNCRSLRFFFKKYQKFGTITCYSVYTLNNLGIFFDTFFFFKITGVNLKRNFILVEYLRYYFNMGFLASRFNINVSVISLYYNILYIIRDYISCIYIYRYFITHYIDRLIYYKSIFISN